MQLSQLHALLPLCITETTTVRAITISHLNNYIAYKTVYASSDTQGFANQLMLEVIKQYDGN